MKVNTVFALIMLGSFSMPGAVAQDKSGRSKVVVSPYTVRIYSVTAGGAQGAEITSNSLIQPNTVYVLRVSTSSPNVATILSRSADGFEIGYWTPNYNDPFVPLPDPTTAQEDGNSHTMKIRTLSGFDFFTPLYMRVLQCSSNCANPGGTGWNTNKVILFPTP